jgi:hypothetical protein
LKESRALPVYAISFELPTMPILDVKLTGDYMLATATDNIKIRLDVPFKYYPDSPEVTNRYLNQ